MIKLNVFDVREILIYFSGICNENVYFQNDFKLTDNNNIVEKDRQQSTATGVNANIIMSCQGSNIIAFGSGVDNICKSKGRSNRQKRVTLFAKEKYTESGLPIIDKSGAPTLCVACADQIIKLDNTSNQEYIGYLTATESLEYAALCKSDSYYDKLLMDGFVVLNGASSPSLESNISTLINTELCASAKMAHKHLDQLTENLSSDGSLSAKNVHRTWQNIYPLDTSTRKYDFVKRNYLVKNSIDRIAPSFERMLFPHEFYFRLAYGRTQSFLSENSEQLQQKQTIQPLLIVKKVNVFAKGEGAKKRQTLHMDGAHLAITFILPVVCGENGYEFFYIPKSHHNMLHHNCNIAIPQEKVVTACVKSGDIIVFADSLIHSGGRSSGFRNGIEEHNHFMMFQSQDFHAFSGVHKEDAPTDISFQISFSHAGSINPSSFVIFGDSNIWFKNDRYIPKNEKEGVVIESIFDTYMEEGLKEENFVHAMEEASIQFRRLVMGVSHRAPMARAAKIKSISN